MKKTANGDTNNQTKVIENGTGQESPRNSEEVAFIQSYHDSTGQEPNRDMKRLLNSLQNELVKSQNHEAFQSIIKLGMGASGWQLASLLYSEFVSKPDNLEIFSGRFAGYMAATGGTATVALVLGMFASQLILEKGFNGEKTKNLKTCALQLLGSVTIADGLWGLAYKFAHGLNGIPTLPLISKTLPYLTEAAVFFLVQNLIHMATQKFASPETAQQSFECSTFFAVVVAGVYISFDYGSAALNELFSVAENSLWTIATSNLATGILAAGSLYAVARLGQNHFFSSAEGKALLEQDNEIQLAEVSTLS